MTLSDKELKKAVKGDVLSDELTRQIYSFGASIYKIKPKCVVFPKDKHDVSETLKFAHRNNIPVTARGACTSLAGQAVGSGIIIDFTKYLNRIVDYSGGDSVIVQPGVVYGSLNKYLAKYGMFFPPDPSSGDYCTIGGMIAGNSGGPHSVKYGSVSDWCDELEVVMSDGSIVRLGPDPSIEPISAALSDLFRENARNIEKYAPKVRRTSSGYNVAGAAGRGTPDLVKLIIGSEGTLAVVTEAKLRLAPLPKSSASVMIILKEISELADAISGLQPAQPSAIEFMDESFIKLAREAEPSVKPMLPKGAKGALLADLEGADDADIDLRISMIKNAAAVAKEPDERDRLWALRRAAVPIMNRVKGKKRPIPFIEDAIVPPENLDEFVMGAYAIFGHYGVEACVYGHAGDGNMHIRPLMDMKDKADLVKMDNMADDFYRMVISIGGSISAEHGDGILRAPYVKKQFGPLYQMFRAIKDIFDPKGILNPGKKIGKEEKVAHDLVYDAGTKYVVTGTVFDSEAVREEVERCHACGLCRNTCPVNAVLPQEFASPRAKAAVIKGIMTGELDAKLLKDPAIKGLLDLCINCRSCRVECPTGADMSQVCSMAKEIYVKEWGVGFSQSALEKVRLLCSIPAKMPGLAKILLGSAPGKFLSELMFGLDSRRSLPVPSGRALPVGKSGGALAARKAVYFTGCYVDLFNAEGEGAAVIKVLQKNNVSVILAGQRCCGMPGISSGNIAGTKKEISANIRELYEKVKAGYDVITSCPSCGLALKEDYPRLLSTPEAVLISQNTYDIHEYLWILLNEGGMNTNFKSSNKAVVFHTPCHLKAQEIGGLQESLVQLIPGISIIRIDDSCCGMAGTFGLKNENYDLSASIGGKLFEGIKSSGADYVVTACGSCKMQIAQFTSAKVIHPVELLSEYYF